MGAESRVEDKRRVCVQGRCAISARVYLTLMMRRGSALEADAMATLFSFSTVYFSGGCEHLFIAKVTGLFLFFLPFRPEVSFPPFPLSRSARHSGPSGDYNADHHVLSDADGVFLVCETPFDARASDECKSGALPLFLGFAYCAK